MALTGKKRAFADAVLAGFSNKEAAIRAGFSEKTASAAGSRLVKDPDVKAYLEQRRAAGAREAAKVPLPPPPADNLVDIPSTDDPMEFLTKLMNEPSADIRIRADVAKALMPFKHQKLGEGGKKDQKNANAKKVASRFAAAAPPQLKAVK
ncbi:terminase small subunit [Massilia sp. NP310]|uniref:terminase small subunit n=1 Tax=Massilia sp. NP310 TaxID=2861282 RepID=UPI001C628E65|nr:terminase small subunit [Massilia sp. NP310]QYG01864.1 terminase small subunit [Massilia sp. NP310]